jgi:hypothetical protein
MLRLHSPLAALPCQISRSGFPDERVFELVTADGTKHTGSGAAHYFWDSSRKPLASHSPSDDGTIDGFVATQVLKVEADRALVEVPDGNVAWVPTEQLINRPSEINLHVPVGS